MGDRMFHVLVIGGIGLVACGGAEDVRLDTASVEDAAAAKKGPSLSEASADTLDASFTPDALLSALLDPNDAPPETATSDAALSPPIADAGYIFPVEAPR